MQKEEEQQRINSKDTSLYTNVQKYKKVKDLKLGNKDQSIEKQRFTKKTKDSERQKVRNTHWPWPFCRA